MTPQPHCDHECVCKIVSLFPGEACAHIRCEHNTRSRPHTPAAPEAIKRNYDGNSFACSECKSFYWKTADEPAPCKTCEFRINEEQQIRESTIRNETLKKEHDIIISKITTILGFDDPDEAYEKLNEWRKSLRSTNPQEQHTTGGAPR